MDAISASVHPTSASRVTAVPRRSLNVTPTTRAFAHALRQEARNPSDVHGVPSMVVRMMVLRLSFAAASSASLSGAPTGIVTVTGRREPLRTQGSTAERVTTLELSACRLSCHHICHKAPIPEFAEEKKVASIIANGDTLQGTKCEGQ